MAKTTITIDQLAKMINQGFKTTASKEDITAFEGRLTTRLDGIDSRLDRIEHFLLAEQKRDIEELKTRMKRLEDAVALYVPPLHEPSETP